MGEHTGENPSSNKNPLGIHMTNLGAEMQEGNPREDTQRKKMVAPGNQ
jgi:hypothetical protein